MADILSGTVTKFIFDVAESFDLSALRLASRAPSPALELVVWIAYAVDRATT